MLHDEYKQFYWRKTDVFRHFAWRRNVTIGQDGRLCIPSVDFPVANGCNLKCEYCFLLNPFRAGIVSKEYVIDSFEKWSRKIAPKRIILAGGEPLLNPDIAELAVAVHRYWQNAQCEVWTNGFLLPRVPDEVLQVFEREKVVVYISQHMGTEEYQDAVQQCLSRLSKFRIQHSVIEAYRDWRNDRHVDADGVPVPCRSNPAVAYSRCISKRCTIVLGDKLYRCHYLAHITSALQEGVAVPEWKRVLTHKPVTFENSPQEIRDYLFGGPMPECSVCPETCEIVEPRQLSMEHIQRIKELIRQRI